MISNNVACVDLGEPVKPPFKLRNSKWCSVSSLTVIEYSRLVALTTLLEITFRDSYSCGLSVLHCLWCVAPSPLNRSVIRGSITL